MKFSFLLLLVVFVNSILFSIQGHATIITFKAEGTDNIPKDFNEDPGFNLDLNDPAANFFSISYVAGNSMEYISKISIHLRAGSDNDAFFDPSDGNKTQGVNDNGGGKGFGPVVGANTIGLVSADVKFNLNTNSSVSPLLEILFADNSFKPNDTLSFGIDVDYLGEGMGNQQGGLFGKESVGLVTTLSGTCQRTVSSTFIKDSENRSVSQVNICEPVTSIAEPNIQLLMLSGLGMVFLIRIYN